MLTQYPHISFFFCFYYDVKQLKIKVAQREALSPFLLFILNGFVGVSGRGYIKFISFLMLIEFSLLVRDGFFYKPFFFSFQDSVFQFFSITRCSCPVSLSLSHVRTHKHTHCASTV